jgi:hypothetical protein
MRDEAAQHVTGASDVAEIARAVQGMKPGVHKVG